MGQFPAPGRGLRLALGGQRRVEPALPAAFGVPRRGPVAENERALHAGSEHGAQRSVESTGDMEHPGLGRFDRLESRNQT